LSFILRIYNKVAIAEPAQLVDHRDNSNTGTGALWVAEAATSDVSYSSDFV
jgi:hypothetical protein